MAQELSIREREVVNLLLQGMSNKLIGFSLGISARTVEFHLKNIYAKYQVNSRIELILLLGNTTGTTEFENLGYSTVDGAAENTENRARFQSWTDWASSIRVTVSRIGKELKMKNFFSASASASDGETTMTFYESIRVCLAKYAEFNGRATRSEFWWFALFVLLVAAALMYLSEILSSIFLIAMLLPFLAAGTRRLRDSGKSGWWQLFLLAPVGGIIMLGFLWALPSIGSLSDDGPVE